MQFFIDGYDSVTVYITYVFYFLAVNPDIQEKVIAEVDEVAEKCNNGEDITGELVNELKYLDQVTFYLSCKQMLSLQMACLS